MEEKFLIFCYLFSNIIVIVFLNISIYYLKNFKFHYHSMNKTRSLFKAFIYKIKKYIFISNSK